MKEMGNTRRDNLPFEMNIITFIIHPWKLVLKNYLNPLTPVRLLFGGVGFKCNQNVNEFISVGVDLEMP